MAGKVDEGGTPDRGAKASKAQVNAVRRRLQAAAKGLTYLSEQDRPIKAFVWDSEAVKGATTPEEAVLAMAGASEEQVHVVPIEDFLAPMTLMPDWYGEEERERARRFRDLLETLREVLDDPQAFRIEKAAGVGSDASVIPVYIVGTVRSKSQGQSEDAIGTTAEGSQGYAGIQTQVVET